MRQLKIFYYKYKPIFIGLFLLFFLIEQGYVIYLKNQNEPTEIPKCNHLNFVYSYDTKDKLQVKVNFAIDYNKKIWLWGAFVGERKIKSAITKMFNEITTGYTLVDMVENISEVEHKCLMRSLYQIEQECSVDIYKTDINISLSKEAMQRYYDIKESERATRVMCSKKH